MLVWSGTAVPSGRAVFHLVRAAKTLLFFTACALQASTGISWAKPGDLDRSFGVGGTLTTSFGGGSDEAFAVVLQPDGKLVAAGHAFNGSKLDFALARY